MKAIVTVKREVELKHLKVEAGVRYWEDSTVNGVEDIDGNLIPCKGGAELWSPVIEIDTGRILGWPQGVVANIHYKVCDSGVYSVLDENENVVLKREGYVPKTMSPKDVGYGDYIIMDVNSEGFIKNWKFNPDEFFEE